MSGRLKDRVAVVTGSGQGIGKAIALAMAKEGARVVTNNRRPGTSGGDAETTAREIIDMGGRAVPFFGDVSNFDDAQKLVQTSVDSFGRLDILINNAGIAPTNAVWNITEEEWDQVVNSSLKASFNCIRHSCSLMMQQGWGRIVNTTSSIRLGMADRSHYGAAKAGIVGLTKCVVRELGSYGITCNAYAPLAATRLTVDPVRIGIYKKRYETGIYTKEQYEAMMNLPGPETVISLPVYLCTDEAANINGQVFHVYRGSIAIYSELETKRSIVKEGGSWSVDELIGLVPKLLLEGDKHPAST